MTFYVRRTRDSEIEGPFTVQQINEMVRRKQLAIKSFALLDSGQDLSAVRNIPIVQWINIAEIPGYEPDPNEQRNCLTKAVVILAIVAILVIIGLVKLVDILHRIQ